MRKGVSIEDAEMPGIATEQSRALTVPSDDIRAFLALCLAASMLSVYTFAWATGLAS
jgi:hypothetical protein